MVVIDTTAFAAGIAPMLKRMRLLMATRIGEMIGTENLDAILLARQQIIPLYSDDLMLRRLATTEYGVAGVHSPALLMTALARGLGARTLKPELSTNLSLGAAWKATSTTTFSADAYRIHIGG